MRLPTAIFPLFLSLGYSATNLVTAFTTIRCHEPLLLPKKKKSKGAGEDIATVASSSFKYVAMNAVDRKSKSSQPSIPDRGKGEPWYWIDEDSRDAFGVAYRDHKEESSARRISSIRFKIRGHPRPLQRHRTSRGHMYNPSIKYQRSFLDAFEELISNKYGQTIETPFFGATEHLAVTIIFRMKRPKSHFVNSRPGPDRLKKNAPSQLSSIRTDVDNLTKFVFDSMNGILYEDDRQVTSIHATKLLDNDACCEGSIEVLVRSVEDDDVDMILQSLYLPAA